MEGSLASVPSTTFLIDFFSSPIPDPSGRGQGQYFLGSTTISTDSNGNGSISFDLATTVPVGYWVTATATNQTTGDSSAFSDAVEAQSASVQFAAADVVVNSTAGTATINVLRSGNPNITVTASFTADSGSAAAGQDYTPVSGTLSFPPGQNLESFAVPILANPSSPTTYETVNLTLGQTGGGATIGSISMASLIMVNTTNPNVSSFVVDNTGDNGNNADPIPGSLRAAILAADADPNPGIDNIVFDIPASIAANLNVPVSGFDPITQTWQIELASPLPAITHPVSIDGYSQGNVPVPYRYPVHLSSQEDDVVVDPSVTGGTFQLSITNYDDLSGTLRGGTTQISPSTPRRRTSRINSTPWWASATSRSPGRPSRSGRVFTTSLSQANRPAWRSLCKRPASSWSVPIRSRQSL